jgi:hypothetical protein
VIMRDDELENDPEKREDTLCFAESREVIDNEIRKNVMAG